MTQDEIYESARQAGFDAELMKINAKRGNPSIAEVFAKLVAASEREACAEIGDTALYQLQETMNELGEHEYMERCVVQGAMNQAAKFTKAIRARGEA